MGIFGPKWSFGRFSFNALMWTCNFPVTLVICLCAEMNIIFNIRPCRWKSTVGEESSHSFQNKSERKKHAEIFQFVKKPLLIWIRRHLGVIIFQSKVMGNREKRFSACVSNYNADSHPHEQFCHWLMSSVDSDWMRYLPRALFSINDFQMSFMWYYSVTNVFIEPSDI